MQIDKIIKREVISLVVSIILILLIFIGVSFASFFSVAEGETNTISIGDIDLTFCSDTTCNENYTNYGQTIGLTDVDGVSTPLSIYPYATDAEALATTPYIFNVENTGVLKLYLNIYLQEDDDFVPTGNYAAYNQTTTLYSNNIKIGIGECSTGIPDVNTVQIYRYGSLIDNKIVTSDELEVGENKTYCLWTWLAEDTPNAVQSTYFVANVSVSGEYLPYQPTLRNTLLKDNTIYADNVSSTYVSSSTGIDFSNVSSDTNGKGLYYTTDTSKTENGKRVYYYRGAVTNNYVIFGGFCWKIIRTNEDGSVRLFYWGTPTNNTCSTTSSAIASLADIEFNLNYIGNEGVGYMYGEAGSTSYEDTHSNITDSTIKALIDTWYLNNLSNQGSSVTSLIANTIYCNDRKIGNGGVVGSYTYTELGYGRNNTLYQPARRLGTNGLTGTSMGTANSTPQYKCPQNNDKFTLSVASGGTLGYGNNSLIYPIGLITADEIVFAGPSQNTFLVTGSNYWTLSPFQSVGNITNVIYFSLSGTIMYIDVADDANAYPSISLNNNAMVSSGTGIYNDPYIINNSNSN